MQPTAGTGSHPGYRADIDGLRAVAVLAVVGFHAFPGWIRGGFVGVDVFFVISGFLISGIIFGNLESGTFSFRDFYARRIRRIFPALVVVLAAVFAVLWFFFVRMEEVGRQITAGALFLSNLALTREGGYFDGSSETKPLLHLWSLSIEEQFYIIWPVLLWGLHRKRWSFLATTATIAGLSFALNIFTVAKSPTVAFYSPASRFWELMVGGILAHFSLRGITIPSRHRDLAGWLGLGFIAAAVLILNGTRLFPGWWALLPTLGAFLVILAGPSAWPNRNLLSLRWVVWVGLISYPLYLWHWPALYVARYYRYDATPRAERLLVVFAVVASFALATATYRLLERPIRYTPDGARSS